MSSPWSFRQDQKEVGTKLFFKQKFLALCQFSIVKILFSGLSDIFNGEQSPARLVPDANNLFTDESSQDNNEVEKTILKPGKIVQDQTMRKFHYFLNTKFATIVIECPRVHVCKN
jgi:hypothetical protein